jgi:hypothetical protein
LKLIRRPACFPVTRIYVRTCALQTGAKVSTEFTSTTHRFEEPWAEFPMNLNRRSQDVTGQLWSVPSATSVIDGIL